MQQMINEVEEMTMMECQYLLANLGNDNIPSTLFVIEAINDRIFELQTNRPKYGTCDEAICTHPNNDLAQCVICNRNREPNSNCNQQCYSSFTMSVDKNGINQCNGFLNKEKE